MEIRRKLTTRLTDKRTGICHEINTEKLKFETNCMFKKRHRLKVKAKKYWLRKINI